MLRKVFRSLGDDLLRQSVADVCARDSVRAALRAVEAERNAVRAECDAVRAACDAARAACDALVVERDALTATCDALAAKQRALSAEMEALYDSTSWRLTGPMRAMGNMFKRLRWRRGK
jgi:hypothetical protein